MFFSRAKQKHTHGITDTVYRHPGEVVIEGDNADSSTPAGEPDDDFFSSWDKPAIKKPTPPISRTSTPPVIGGRTPSPFIAAGANGKDIQRTASPLSKIEGDAPAAKPTASRITSSAALRKTTTGAGPRKANVLGAKKVAPKLGVKKVTADAIDFDEAEKKAKEEAERIAKLGYDPDAEEDNTTKKNAKTESSSNIVSPTPVSPVRGGYGSGHSREKSASEVERLGMGVARLGFGQIGGAKAAAGAQKKNMGGFGSVGPIKASQEGQLSVLFLLDQPYASIH
jgi:ADP-ribosylation factor GTPase-activating protein 2/3